MNPNSYIIDQPQAVIQALSKLGLSLEQMQRIAQAAAIASSDTLKIDVAFKRGMSSYMYGTRYLRLELLPLKGSRMCRNGHVESVVNDEYDIQIQFVNVDVACVPGYIPQPLSPKGRATKQQIMQGEQLELDLFSSASNKRVIQYLKRGPVVWWLCVSNDGQRLRCELSQPDSFEGKQVQSFSQRIFLLDQSITPEVIAHYNHNILDFEIEVTKNNTYV